MSSLKRTFSAKTFKNNYFPKEKGLTTFLKQFILKLLNFKQTNKYFEGSDLLRLCNNWIFVRYLLKPNIL